MVKVIKLKLRDVYTAQFLLMIESTFIESKLRITEPNNTKKRMEGY